MAQATGIEWTDATWNPIRGCSRVSEGCRNCYAEKVAYRFSGPGQPYEGLVQMDSAISLENARRKPLWNGQIRFVEEHLLDPLKWKKPQRIFVNSMSDLFHENVTDEMLHRIFAVMALAPQHTFQVLTKRPERMLEYFTTKHRNPQGWPEEDYDVQTCIRLSLGGLLGGRTLPNGRPDILSYFKSGRASRYADADKRLYDEWPLPNVWLGVSVENRKAKERIDVLREVPAAVRFLSVEPLLEELGNVDLAWIHWVICGGESGPNARPMHPDSARSLRDQCIDARVPFFFKQWGEWSPTKKDEDGSIRLTVPWEAVRKSIMRRPDCAFGDNDDLMFRLGKKAAGRLLDGREWNEFPAVLA